MNILGHDLKKLEKDAIPAPLREQAEREPDAPINVAPDILALSEAISLKRIADALEDGLTTLTPGGEVLGLADVAFKNAAPTITNLVGGKKQ